MARPKMKGNRNGPGGLILSAIVLLIAVSAIFAVGKANGINSPGALIDWAKSSSEKIRGCLQPDVKFWICSFDGGATSPGGNGGDSDGSGGGAGDGAGDGGSSGGVPDPSAPSTPGAPGTPAPASDAMLAKLSTLTVGDPQKVDYDRGQWKHWAGDRCNDVRQQVLREQAVSYALDGDGCKVASGEWIDPYTGAKFTDPSKLDIDHVYALGAAARNGGNGWDAATKEAFANDKSHLLAVSASANRSKSDRNPAEWWPENASYSCAFATKYVDVAAKYSLQFSDEDVSALEKGLKTCG